MEKTSSNTLSPSVFVVILLIGVVLNWAIRFHKFYSSSLCFFHSIFHIFFPRRNDWSDSESKSPNDEVLGHKFTRKEKVEDENLTRENAVTVMRAVGIVCDPEEEKFCDTYSSNEISVLFEVEEPSVGEVKEAFDVFDVNRDGFVDAGELQRVLCGLGFVEGSKMEECENMIRVFDDNRDGFIDFKEFVKLMESSFC
ncbi:hypothetical protein ACHQM5_006320 [Ranunculus cassubicifolius]